MLQELQKTPNKMFQKKKKPRRPFRRVTVITLTQAGRVWLIMQLCLKERKIREPEQWSMTGLKLGTPYLYQVLQFTPTYQFKCEFFQWPKTVQSPSSQRLVIRKLRAKTNLSCRTDVKPWSFSITLCCCFLVGTLWHLASVFTTWGGFSVKTVFMFTSVFA